MFVVLKPIFNFKKTFIIIFPFVDIYRTKLMIPEIKFLFYLQEIN
jgi:hypothetical protein